MANFEERALEVLGKTKEQALAEMKEATAQNTANGNQIQQVGNVYDAAIDQWNDYTNAAISAVDQNKASNEKLLKDQHDYTVDRIEQEKENAEKDFRSEKSQAYVDYQKQIDPYGVQAEQLAASGLSNSGYAESLKTQAYVAYQNRLAIANQSYQQAIVDYNNASREASIQNSVQLQELANQALQSKLELALNAITQIQTLTFDKANTIYTLAKEVPEEWLGVYEQIYADYANGSSTSNGNSIGDILSNITGTTAGGSQNSNNTGVVGGAVSGALGGAVGGTANDEPVVYGKQALIDAITSEDSGISFKTPTDAQEFIEKNGLNTISQKLLTHSEWIESNGENSNETYEDYLRNYVIACINLPSNQAILRTIGNFLRQSAAGAKDAVGGYIENKFGGLKSNVGNLIKSAVDKYRNK